MGYVLLQKFENLNIWGPSRTQRAAESVQESTQGRLGGHFGEEARRVDITVVILFSDG